MWPRRQAAASNADVKKTTTAASGFPRMRGTAATAQTEVVSVKHARPSAAESDDCGWLLRAHQMKKKKAKELTEKKTSDVTKGKKRRLNYQNPSSSTKSNAATGSSTVAGLGGDGMSRQMARKESGGPRVALSSWKQKQQAWNAGIKAHKDHEQKQRQHTANATVNASEEQFEDVFLEVFGRQTPLQQKQQQEQFQPTAYETAKASGSLLDQESITKIDVARCIDASVAQNNSLIPETQPLSAQIETQWKFASESDHLSLCLDDFELKKEAASVGNNVSNQASKAEFMRWKDENSSQAVSDNYVKLNMRKRFKGSTGKPRKLPAYLRSRSDASNMRGHSDFNGEDMVDPSAGMEPLDAPPSLLIPSAGGSTDDNQQTGYMNDDLDFIQECLEVLARVEHAHSTTSGKEATQSSSDTQTKEVPPPRCHHALLCQKLVVKKKNKNHGRAFFSCPLGFEEGRCDFFLWEDNHTQLALQSLFTQSSMQVVNGEEEAKAERQFVPLDLSVPIEDQEEALVMNLRLVFGHSVFRPGQQWAIMRIFQQKHSLLVLPTGAGKSLCYQYPAMFLPGITIVISPLISLMNDQYQNLPPILKNQAVCLASSAENSKAKYAEFVRDLLGGKLKLLFLSPEKALSNGFQQLLFQIRSRISLVCVDEAHCISEWSHHFRPSYLRLQKIFQWAKCVLAITATASNRVIQDILAQFQGDADMVMQMPWQRSNLELEVRRVDSNEARVQHLCRFLTTQNIKGGIILYVHQQRQAENMAACLKEQLPASWTKKIAYYHARMDADAKEKVRVGFVSGRLRVIIATIAFGMGIDKQNVRCVVHFHMPSSIENYLQQVGRAGRDGKPARGLLYLLPQDVQMFRSFCFTNAFHRDQLQQLLSLVLLAGESTDERERALYGQHVVSVQSGDSIAHLTMEMEWLEVYLDMKSATIDTFLTLLTLQSNSKDEKSGDKRGESPVLILLEPRGMSRCTIHLLEKQFRVLPSYSIVKKIIDAITNKQVQYARIDTQVNGYLSVMMVDFHVREMAEHLFPNEKMHGDQTDSDISERKLLQHVRKNQYEGQIQRFTLEKVAFRLQIMWKKSVNLEEKRNIVTVWADEVYAKHEALEQMELMRLTRLYGALHAASLATEDRQVEARSSVSQALREEKAKVLKTKLEQYFQDEAIDPADEELMKKLVQQLTPQVIEAIERDVRSLSLLPVVESDDGTQMQQKWTCFSVAKIFHGIATPCFPSLRWRDHVCWRKYEAFPFEQLVRIADKVLREKEEYQ